MVPVKVLVRLAPDANVPVTVHVDAVLPVANTVHVPPPLTEAVRGLTMAGAPADGVTTTWTPEALDGPLLVTRKVHVRSCPPLPGPICGRVSTVTATSADGATFVVSGAG